MPSPNFNSSHLLSRIVRRDRHQMKQPPPPEEAARKRRFGRKFMSCWAIGGGILFAVFGGGWLVNGIPVSWLGYVLVLIGVLGLLGVNVFYGGPLDLRLDREPQRSQRPEEPK